MSDDLLDDLDAIDGILTGSGGDPGDTFDDGDDTDVAGADAVTVDEDDATNIVEPVDGMIDEVRPVSGSSSRSTSRPRTSFPVSSPDDSSAETTPRGQNRVGQRPGPPPKPNQPPPSNRSGGHPAATSGSFNAPPSNQSGGHPAATSGSFNAPPSNQSGGHPAAASGAFNAPPANQSGGHPSAQSGAIPTPDLERRGPSNTGGFPQQAEENFYSIPTGHTGTLPEVEPGPTRRTFGQTFVRGVFVALPIGLIAAAVVAYFCVVRWLSPSQAMLWTVLGACCPALFASIVVTWPAEGQRNSAGAWIAGMVPGLVAGGAALLIPFAWANADIREQTLEYVPDDPNVLTKLWAEKDMDLAVHACKQMLEHSEDPEWRMSVLANLTLRPASTATCLNRLEDQQLKERIVATVLTRWEKDLLADAGEADGARLCQIAQSMTELPTEARNVDARLLTCTLTAPTEVAQACCSKILVSSIDSHDDMIERIRAGLDVLSGREAAGNLMSMAFHNHNLTQPQQALSRKMKFSSRPARIATLRLACQSLRENEDTVTVQHMTASLPKNCSVSQELAPTAVDPWLGVCDHTLAAVEADDVIAPEEALCEGAETAFTRLAIASADEFVSHAVRSNQRSGLGREIDLGFQRELSQITDQEDYVEKMRKHQELMASGMSPEQAAKRLGISQAEMYRAATQANPSAPPDSAMIGEIMGQAFGPSGVQGELSKGDIAKFREAAENAGVKIAESETPEGEPPEGMTRPDE